MKITLIGAGNVATHLGLAFSRAGHEIIEVFSRTEHSASLLAERLGCSSATLELFKDNGSDLYLISLKDDIIGDIAHKLMPKAHKGIWAHTSGSVGIDILDDVAKECEHDGHMFRTGVFYPMQTFSKEKSIDLNRVSIFVESHSCIDELLLLGRTISPHVYELSSDGRKRLHLAAVFACNFVNHCYVLSEQILNDMNLPFEVMLPLIDETAQKVHVLSPMTVQTGPAARADINIISMHEDMLNDTPYIQTLYKILSENIMRIAELRNLNQ